MVSSKDPKRKLRSKKSPLTQEHRIYVLVNTTAVIFLHTLQKAQNTSYTFKALNSHNHKFLISILRTSSVQTIDLNMSKIREQSFIDKPLGRGHSFSHLFI